MNKFSVSILPEKVKLYTCQRDDFMNVIMRFKLYDFTKDIICQTFLNNEITFYMYYKEDDKESLVVHKMFTKICTSDQRIYHVFDIHEDLPGIDHIGIIHHISKYFLKKEIPIMYFNTYGHNIILVSSEYMENALQILNEIAHL
jgi:hypothetical protein